jgi:hypothetical protein
MKTEVIERISSATIFKLLFLGNAITFLMITLVVALFVIVSILPLGPGIDEVSVSFSLGAIGIYFGISILFLPFGALCTWLATFPGLWLWSKFKPISITFTPVSDA